MASEATTSAFSDGDKTEILDSDCKDYTSKAGKDTTVIQSKVTVITEKKTIKVSTKFTVPHQQHVFFAMKATESVLEKLSG